MPTIAGFRRRGYTPEAIRDFCERIGVAKKDSLVETALLEHCLREDLNRRAPRAMAVLRPLRLVIENYPEGQEEMLEAVNNPEDPAMGTREVPFSRVLYIEQDDFREHPHKKYFRLFPGNEVRLRYAYFIRCTDVVKDEATGEVVEVRCTYDPATRGGDAPDGRRVKSTIHWVSAAHAVEAEVRLYEPLFTTAVPGADKDDWKADLNPEVAGAAHGLPPRAEPRRRRAGSALSVRAQRVLLRGRQGLRGGPSGLEPRGGAARLLGQDREGGRVGHACKSTQESQPARETIMPKKRSSTSVPRRPTRTCRRRRGLATSSSWPAKRDGIRSRERSARTFASRRGTCSSASS